MNLEADIDREKMANESLKERIDYLNKNPNESKQSDKDARNLVTCIILLIINSGSYK